MKKKGQGIQFNWIFVIISGILILTSLVFFTVKYVELRNERDSVFVSGELNLIFMSTKSTSQYKDFSTSFNFDLDFICDGFVVNNDYKSDIDYVLFGFDVKGVSNLVIWSREFENLFKIDNVVYVFDSSKTISITGHGGFADTFPDSINIVSDSNSADILVDFSGSNCFNLPNRKEICVDQVNNKIRFLDENQIVEYYDDSLIYAAIVSDYDSFVCSTDKLYEKWSTIFNIYSIKSENLSGGCTDKKLIISNKLFEISQNIPFVDVEELGEIIILNNGLLNLDCGVVF